MEQFFHNTIRNIMSNVGITDILDILIVAFLFYKLLGFIRETRAEQLAKGLVLLVIATVVSKACHLYTLHWILSGVLNAGLIAIVVIFQPELRRLLENIGRSRISNVMAMVDSEEAEAIIKEIVEASEIMSASKTGALMVFEREISLNDIIETGTVIDAKIDSQVIGNIFYEGAPLHDGALIIRGERLHAAGCVLPLTSNKGLGKELGTRHRAGLGITENSDALVVIVSEETGIISIAEEGKLRRPVTIEELKTKLHEMYFEEKKDTIFERISKMIKGDKHVSE